MLLKIQVSKIEGCKLTRQGDLPFDFYLGSCNSFMNPTPQIVLCFAKYAGKECHSWVLAINVQCYNILYKEPSRRLKINFSFDGNNYGTIGDSKYYHRLSLGNYQGNAFITGCNKLFFMERCHKKTEILDMATLTWFDAPDFPFTE